MQKQLLTTSQRQTNAQPLPKQWPPWQPKTRFALPLPQFLLLSMVLCGMEYPFGLWTSLLAVLAVSPPTLLPTPSLLAGRTE